MTIRQHPRVVRAIFAVNQLARDEWVEAVARSMPNGTKILDVGAGSCPYRHLFQHCEYRTHDFAKLERNDLSGGVGYGTIDYVSDILAMPLPDASFDAILCTEVLEHVPDPAGAIKECARILRPGGLLFVSAPLGSGLHQKPFHFYGGFTPYWYERFLDEAGCDLVSVVANGGFYRLWAQENVRFMFELAPWRSWQNALLTPLWLCMLPFSGLVAPLFAWLCDPLDRTRDFTIGYHVQARRRV